jgi:hypothetical protein
VNGKYDILPFIQSIKRFKSVELYIASLELKALAQSGYIDISADTGSEQTLKPEEVAALASHLTKHNLLLPCFGTITHRLI